MNYRVLGMAILVSLVPLFLDAKSLPRDPENSPSPATNNIYDRLHRIENMDSHTAEVKQEPLFKGEEKVVATSPSHSRASRKPSSFSEGE